MVVGFHFPHNEGVVYGIFTEADQDTNLLLVDLYEVDGRIRTFNEMTEAQQWLGQYESVREGEVKPNEVYDFPSFYPEKS